MRDRGGLPETLRMDAGIDRDIKLQRASNSFIDEFRAKLPHLLWKQPNPSHDGSIPQRRPHRWAQAAKTEKLINLLEPFQEWPQLIDPYLHDILANLVDAFLVYLLHAKDQYSISLPIRIGQIGAIYHPLPRSICKLIYVLCKVRGVKVVSRFFNNEPKYLEPMTRSFVEWNAIKPKDDGDCSTDRFEPMIWEERYVMLLWISHLLLAPFPLDTLSSNTLPIPYDNLDALPGLSSHLPRIALVIISICLKHVFLPTKEREGATVLLARLALRLDMQRDGLLSVLSRWAMEFLDPNSNEISQSVYAYIGVLSFVSRLYVSGQFGDLASFILPIFNQIVQLSEGNSAVCQMVMSSASARKIIIKILRTITILIIAISDSRNAFSNDTVSIVLESAIDYFLVSLGDQDTPVRFAASKALSYTAFKLDENMISDVIEAVIGSLEENILFEKQDGTVVTRLESKLMGIDAPKRNVSAVDPLRWQGLLLTLGHLLFRRSVPTSQLPQVLQSLVSGLDFEQRSSTGSSIGTAVRDAACFGIWSLSRKYSTPELMDFDTHGLLIAPTHRDQSTIQSLALQLVCAACLDPWGNIRRGASAALQEMIGRHPDTIMEGISLVQVVDYHAIARRSRALIEVAKDSAVLGSIYWESLFDGLLQWRGLGSLDAQSRRTAASAVGEFSTLYSYKSMSTVLDKLVNKLSVTSPHEIEIRHGIYLAVSSTVEAFTAYCERENTSMDPNFSIVVSLISNLWYIFDSSMGPSKDSLTLSTLRPDLTSEASANLISSLSRSCMKAGSFIQRPENKFLDKALDVLLLCVSRSNEIPVIAASDAASDLFLLLDDTKKMEIVQNWVLGIRRNWKLEVGSGHVAALGKVFWRMPHIGNGRQLIVDSLLKSAAVEETIAKRISAVNCIAKCVVPHLNNIESISGHLIAFLNDYTTDRRGDIGSFIRIEALEAVKVILKMKQYGGTYPSYIQDLIASVVHLASERLDKVRFNAWTCLEIFWINTPKLPPLHSYEHFSEVSSVDYFLQLFHLLDIEWLRVPLMMGLATSLSSGTEAVVRSSRFALVQYAFASEDTCGDKSIRLLADLVSVLERTLPDDRFAIPAVDAMSFVFDACFSTFRSPLDTTIATHITMIRKLFVLVQKSHFKTTRIPRIEAAIRVYGTLWSIPSIHNEVEKKMTNLLLHPYPKIRNSAVDYLFLTTGDKFLEDGDWTVAPKDLKEKVAALRSVYRSEHLVS